MVSLWRQGIPTSFFRVFFHWAEQWELAWFISCLNLPAATHSYLITYCLPFCSPGPDRVDYTYEFVLAHSNRTKPQKESERILFVTGLSKILNQIGCRLIDRRHTSVILLSCAVGPSTALMVAMCRHWPQATAHISPAGLCCLGSDRFQLGLFSAAVYCLLLLPWQIRADLRDWSTMGDSDGWPGGAGWQLEVRPGGRQPCDRFSLTGSERRRVEWMGY